MITVIESLDKLGAAGYVLDQDCRGVYLGRAGDKGDIPLDSPLLREALDCLMSNKEATVCYFMGLYP